MHDAPTGLSRQVQAIARQLAPADPPDGELLARWHARQDEAAFAELVRRHGPLVWGVCRRAAADADDAYQAVFLLLATRAGRLTGRATVAPWLYLTAVRVARRAVRTAVRRRVKEQAAARPEAVSPPEPADWRPVFDAVVAGLPARYRDAVVLCELGGLPRTVAADRLGVPVGTLASRLAAARVLLRHRLARRGVTAGALTVAGVPPAVTAGVASVVARQLAYGVTTMAMLKTLVLAGVLAGVGVAAWPGRQPPAPATVPPAELAWKADFRKSYGLAEGQVVRRVPPPYPAVREQFFKDRYPPSGPAHRTGIPLDDYYTSYRWRDGWVTPGGSTRAGRRPADGVPLGVLLEMATGVPEFEQRVDAAMRDRHVTGEFVVRDGAELAAVAAAVERVLRAECELAVTLRVETVEREVYVVGGRYDPRPLGGRRPGQIDVFADYRPARGADDELGGGVGSLAEFVAHLGGYLGRSLRYEGVGPQLPRVEWRYQARRQARRDPGNGTDDWAEDHDPDVVLPNVAAQTGLTFTKQKRAVQTLVAEPVK